MKYFKYFLLPLFSAVVFYSTCIAQSKQESDTNYILQLVAGSSSMRDSDPDRSLQMASEALNRSIQLNYRKGMTLAYSKLGRWYFGNNIDSSIVLARKSLNLLESDVVLPEAKADMHLLLAEAFDERGRTDSSAYYYYLLGDEAESGSGMSPEFMLAIYTKLTIFWINLIEGSRKDDKITNTIRGYVQKAKSVSRQIKDTATAIPSIDFLQGIYYHGIEEYDSARYFYGQYLQAWNKMKNPSVLRKISALTNITGTYLQQNRPAEALPYINQVKDMGNDPAQGNYLSFFMAFNGLLEGKALFQLKQYSPAIQVLEQSIKNLKSTGSHLRNEVVDAYKDLARSYENLGQYRQAMINMNTYSTLKDSLSRKEKLDMISRQEIRYRIAEKDKELVKQQLTIAEVRNKVRNKNVVIAGIVVMLLIVALLFTMWRRRNIHKHKLQKQQIENLQQKIRIERLNATIAGEEKERNRIARELHDGVGGLITAAKLNFEMTRRKSGNESDPDFQKGIKLLQEAGEELRQSIQNLVPEILIQEGLVKAVRVFCDKMSEKSNTQINFESFGEKTEKDPHFELTVYRIIQELIHNIVKHSRAKTAIVQINFHKNGGMNITVEDDGVGINKTTVTKKSGGMGLSNIKERIIETGGKLDIVSNEGEGTSVYIEYESQSE